MKWYAHSELCVLSRTQPGYFNKDREARKPGSVMYYSIFTTLKM